MALTDEAIDKIKEMIISGRVRPGEKLPKEADLAAELGLSRNSLREAVKALSLINVLDVRQGDGTYATSLAPSLLLEALSFMVDFHRDDTVLEFLEVRRILEPAATGMAAAIAIPLLAARHIPAGLSATGIAAVIVEPMAGSTGVLPPPQGYLQRLRAICDRHGILLIFDEVFTGFGRLGYAFAAERYGVVPDLIAFAKGVTSGAVPMGGVIASDRIYEAFMHGPEHVIELFHGYTYSAHPLACAAGL